jgi:hypothetical protein
MRIESKLFTYDAKGIDVGFKVEFAAEHHFGGLGIYEYSKWIWKGIPSRGVFQVWFFRLEIFRIGVV